MAMFVHVNYAYANMDERHIQVGMRMIGHEVLLNACDETSRVLPIEKEENRYKIRFSSDFEFDPAQLVSTVNQIIEKTEISHGYIVEVETCDSNKVVYSYEMGHTSQFDMIPCQGRVLPKACYSIFVTIMDPNAEYTSVLNSTNLLTPPSELSNKFDAEKFTQNTLAGKKGGNLNRIALLILPLFLLIGSIFYFRRKKEMPITDPDLISIGDFLFNKRTMTLSHLHEKIELTSKEADLLFLLYKSSNKTLERENILNVVWGDDGDYTGRTLDVFISKLRKKLVADSSLKIVNIRGIGYKFVVNH